VSDNDELKFLPVLNTTEEYQALISADRPDVRTLDQDIIKIGDQLQVESEPMIPHGIPVPVVKKQEWEIQLPWILLSLIIGLLVNKIIFKKR
jgi:hypothetical protein